jgi:hypothetical protein
VATGVCMTDGLVSRWIFCPLVEDFILIDDMARG